MDNLEELKTIEHQGILVLTTKQIAEKYEAEEQIITNNFNRNKKKYTEGKHYICLTGNDLREFRAKNQNDVLPNANKFYLRTQKGALLHAKSLNTDKAWEAYEYLIDSYFNRKKTMPMTIQEQIQLLAKGNVELEQKIDAVSKDLQEFKEDMPLLVVECEKITKAKNRKVVPLMGGKESNAYKDNSLRGKVYSDVDSQLKREFGVTTYKAIKRNQCDLAVSIIEKYELPMSLEEEIKNTNAQMNIEF